MQSSICGSGNCVFGFHLDETIKKSNRSKNAQDFVDDEIDLCAIGALLLETRGREESE